MSGGIIEFDIQVNFFAQAGQKVSSLISEATNVCTTMA